MFLFTLFVLLCLLVFIDSVVLRQGTDILQFSVRLSQHGLGLHIDATGSVHAVSLGLSCCICILASQPHSMLPHHRLDDLQAFMPLTFSLLYAKATDHSRVGNDLLAKVRKKTPSTINNLTCLPDSAVP